MITKKGRKKNMREKVRILAIAEEGLKWCGRVKEGSETNLDIMKAGSESGTEADGVCDQSTLEEQEECWQ